MMNPVAGPSGPGRFSTRTDLPPSKEYGERKATQEIMQGAPTATTRGPADPQVGRPRTALPEVTPLFAPSQRPDEPITTGIDLGEGPGSNILGMRPTVQEKLSDVLARMIPYDDTGEVEILYQRALARGM
jgi:hypothetical protein